MRAFPPFLTTGITGILFRGSIAKSGRRPTRRKFGPSVEILENRAVPAVYTLDRLGDIGNGTGDSGDLRYLINRLNNSVDQDNTINFLNASETAGVIEL